MIAWIVLAVVGMLLFSAAYAARAGAPWVPTRKADIDRLVALLDLKPGQTFVELGAGDARVCCEVARRTGANAVGVELSLLQYAAARLRIAFGRHQRVRMHFGSAASFDLSQADAVYLFLMPEAYARLAPKLLQELKPGAVVVSYVWPIPKLQAQHTDRVAGCPDFYVYSMTKTPLNPPL